MLRTYLQTALYLWILLAGVNLAVYLFDYRGGLLLSGFVLLYFGITLYLFWNSKTVIMTELVSFATEYGQIQRQLLRELELPYALLDDRGRIIWTNEAFEQVTHKPKGYSKALTTVFPDIMVDKLLGDLDEGETQLS